MASSPKTALDAWLAARPKAAQTWIKAHGFSGALGQVLTFPNASGEIEMAYIGYGKKVTRARGRFALARAQAALPPGTYRLNDAWPMTSLRRTPWDGCSRATGSPDTAMPSPWRCPGCTQGIDAARIEALAAGEALTRDLINTPTADMGPDALEEAVRDLASDYGAGCDVIVGDHLLDEEFPMIHAVGRAAATQPR